MFSSLLPLPKHSEYATESSKIKVAVPKADKLSQKVLSIPMQVSSEKTSIIKSDNEVNNGTISKLIVNKDGSVNYSQTIAISNNKDNRSVQTSYEDTIPLKKRYPNLKHHFPRFNLRDCPDNSLQTCVDDTRNVINKILNAKLGISAETNSSASSSANSNSDVNIIKYTSNSLIQDEEESRGRERIIQVRQYVEDPMLPPKFKLRKNRHKTPSPPPPILKNVNELESKLTKEDREKWKIPAAISNWKNNQGFTISLDKRILAANGGSVPGESQLETNLNIEKFGNLSTALEDADRKAREEIRVKNEAAKLQAIKDKQEKELQLKRLADLSRNQRKRHYDTYEGDIKRRPLNR
ncbi:component of the spliceosome [Scheffersomyces amazonensis]|uniref:component of the spliceosome n=1 Tax=Scheffersomyces amazonensis TaxID=1078765 RepID=UPI00315D7208